MYFKKLGAWLVGRNDLPQQFRRYKQTVFWLYREVFRRRPGTALLALATNFVAPVLMGSALSLLIYFANLLESNKTLDLSPLPLVLQPREPFDFGLMVACLGLLMLSSGLVLLWANQITIRLAVRFAQDESQSVLTLQGARPWRGQDPSPGPYPKDVQRCAAGIIPMARAIRPLLQLFRPLFLLLFSLAALFYFNPWLTLIVILLVLPSLLFQYRINFTAAKNQELMGPALRKMQKGINKQLELLGPAPWPKHSQSLARELQDTYSRSSINELPERYITRVLARAKSQAVSSILIAVLSVIIVTHLGISALGGQISWSLMLGYLAFARIAMTSLRNLLGMVTGFARHYPISRRSFELLSSWPGPRRLQAKELKIRRNHRESPGDLKQYNFQRDEILAALSAVHFTRYNTFAWADALAYKGGIDRQTLWGAMDCIPDATHASPGASLRELLAMPLELPESQIREKATGLDFQADLSQIDVDAVLQKELWETLPLAFRCHLLLDAGARTKGDILLLEHTLLQGAQEAFLKNWWPRVSKRFLLVRYPNISQLGHWGENKVLALRSDRITALMTVQWAKQNRRLLRTWMGEAKHLEEEEDFELTGDDD